MATKLKRSTGAKVAPKKLIQALEESTESIVKTALTKQIDEYGTCLAILAPFAETIKKAEQLKEKIRDNMIKLDLLEAEGKSFEAVREVTSCRVLDMLALENQLGDLEPYKKDGKRHAIKVKPRIQSNAQRT